MINLLLTIKSLTAMSPDDDIAIGDSTLGDLNFKAMGPDAVKVLIIAVVAIITGMGITAAFRTSNPKSAVAIGIISAAFAGLCASILIYSGFF